MSSGSGARGPRPARANSSSTDRLPRRRRTSETAASNSPLVLCGGAPLRDGVLSPCHRAAIGIRYSVGRSPAFGGFMLSHDDRAGTQAG